MTHLARGAALVVSVCAFSYAQTGAIQGVVVDSAGGTVPNARVSALDQDKKLITRETTTSSRGAFSLRPLMPGRYSVKIQAAGFKTLERTDLVLDQNQVLSLGTLTLHLGATTESVTVAADVPLLDTDTAHRGFTVTSRQVVQLPLNGRDFTSLMRTLPGVLSNERTDFRLAFNNTDQFNVNGLRGSMNNVFLDGSINTDVGANDGQYTQISLDSVAEFRVQTSTFNAEYGRNPGVMISISTKAGSKEFHGAAYEFLRDNALDGRRPFDTTGKTQPLSFHQFGANLGGPVRNNVFFFMNYEGTRATRPASSQTFLDVAHRDLLRGDLSRLYRPGFILDANNQPTQFRNGQVFRPGTVVRGPGGRVVGGDPYPNNVIPPSDWSRNAPAFLQVVAAFDRSAGQELPGSPELLRVPFTPTYKFHKNALVARIDWHIGSKTNLFYRWADDRQDEQNNLGIFASTPFPIVPQYRAKPGRSHGWTLINVISSRLTNEAIVTFNDLDQIVDVAPGTPVEQYDRTALGFKFQELYPEVNTRNRFPRFNCNVGACNFTGFASNWRSTGRTYAFTDNVTWNKGPHTLKFGAFYNENRNGQQPAWTDAINISFAPGADNPRDTGNDFANLLTGNYTSISQSNGVFFGSFRFRGVEAYVQDSWKISPRFTLEYGLRWAWMGPTYTQGTYLQNYFDPRAYDPTQAAVINTTPGARNGAVVRGNPANGMIEEGSEGFPRGGMQERRDNWGPRLGFAWDLTGDGKTALRGGAGVFYERIRQNTMNFDGLGNPPLVYNPTIYGGNVDNISPALIAQGTRFPVAIRGHDSQGQVPTVYSWSIGLQRQLPGGITLDAAYVGNAGRHLMYQRDLNQLPLGTTVQPGVLERVNNTLNALRPYLGYTTVTFTEFGAVSNYHGLQSRLSRRFGNLTANANWTWSRSSGDTDSDTTTIGYSYDRRREYGPLGFDRTHTVTLDWVYDLPAPTDGGALTRGLFGGWQIAGIARFWSGPPATITSNGNPGTLGGGVRADWNGAAIEPADRNRFEYFNPLAFARPQDGSLGNLGRNTLRLPGIHQWDIALYKNTRLTERFTAQFRIETFNTFNRAQWAAVNTAISVPNPGEAVTSATRGQTGVVTETRDPRNIQLALKILF